MMPSKPSQKNTAGSPTNARVKSKVITPSPPHFRVSATLNPNSAKRFTLAMSLRQARDFNEASDIIKARLKRTVSYETALHVLFGAQEIAQVPRYNAIMALMKRRFITPYLDARNQSGDTVLHRAICADADVLVSALIQEGADVSIQNGRNEAPILLALRYKAYKSFELLLEAKSPVIWHSDKETNDAYSEVLRLKGKLSIKESAVYEKLLEQMDPIFLREFGKNPNSCGLETFIVEASPAVRAELVLKALAKKNQPERASVIEKYCRKYMEPADFFELLKLAMTRYLNLRLRPDKAVVAPLSLRDLKTLINWVWSTMELPCTPDSLKTQVLAINSEEDMLNACLTLVLLSQEKQIDAREWLNMLKEEVGFWRQAHHHQYGLDWVIFMIIETRDVADVAYLKDLLAILKQGIAHSMDNSDAGFRLKPLDILRRCVSRLLQESSLLEAAARGDLDSMEALLIQNSELKFINTPHYGSTPMHQLVRAYINKEVPETKLQRLVQFALLNGASVLTLDDEGESAASLALSNLLKQPSKRPLEPLMLIVTAGISMAMILPPEVGVPLLKRFHKALSQLNASQQLCCSIWMKVGDCDNETLWHYGVRADNRVALKWAAEAYPDLVTQANYCQKKPYECTSNADIAGDLRALEANLAFDKLSEKSESELSQLKLHLLIEDDRVVQVPKALESAAKTLPDWVVAVEDLHRNGQITSEAYNDLMKRYERFLKQTLHRVKASSRVMDALREQAEKKETSQTGESSIDKAAKKEAGFYHALCGSAEQKRRHKKDDAALAILQNMIKNGVQGAEAAYACLTNAVGEEGQEYWEAQLNRLKPESSALERIIVLSGWGHFLASQKHMVLASRYYGKALLLSESMGYQQYSNYLWTQIMKLPQRYLKRQSNMSISSSTGLSGAEEKREEVVLRLWSSVYRSARRTAQELNIAEERARWDVALMDQLKQLRNAIIRYSQLGRSPCRYAVIALNRASLLTAYPEMSWAILVEKDNLEAQEYLAASYSLWSIMVNSLGESGVEAHEAETQYGLRLLNTGIASLPQGLIAGTEAGAVLIGTPATLAAIQDKSSPYPDRAKRGLWWHRHVGGDIALTNAYRDLLLQQPIAENREVVARHQLEKAVQYWEQFNDPQYSPRYDQLDMYTNRLWAFLKGLCYLHGIFPDAEQPGHQGLLAKLEQQKVITSSLAQRWLEIINSLETLLWSVQKQHQSDNYDITSQDGKSLLTSTDWETLGNVVGFGSQLSIHFPRCWRRHGSSVRSTNDRFFRKTIHWNEALGQGLLHKARGNYKEARRYYEAGSKCVDGVWCMLGLARLAYRQNQLVKATQNVDKILSQAPKDSYSLLFHATWIKALLYYKEDDMAMGDKVLIQLREDIKVHYGSSHRLMLRTQETWDNMHKADSQVAYYDSIGYGNDNLNTARRSKLKRIKGKLPVVGDKKAYKQHKKEKTFVEESSFMYFSLDKSAMDELAEAAAKEQNYQQGGPKTGRR